MKVTFMDAGALIAAARGQRPEAAASLAILDEPDRVFASSVFVRLEVLPKPIHHRRTAEAAFCEASTKPIHRATSVKVVGLR